MKKFLPLIVVTVFFFGTVGVYAFVSNSNASELNSQQQTIVGLENQKSIAQSTTQSAQVENIETATGFDFARKDEDDKIARDFLKLVFNWSSYEEYNKVREDVMAQYGLNESSSFMKEFLPKIPVINSFDETSTTNIIDANGYNMRYKNFVSYATSISGDKYFYFAVVDVQTSDKNGNDASAQTAFEYSVDANGMMGDLKAYPVG